MREYLNLTDEKNKYQKIYNILNIEIVYKNG